MGNCLHRGRLSDEPWYGSEWRATGCLVVCAWLRALAVYNKTHHHEAVYTTSDTTKHVACLFLESHSPRSRTLFTTYTRQLKAPRQLAKAGPQRHFQKTTTSRRSRFPRGRSRRAIAARRNSAAPRLPPGPCPAFAAPAAAVEAVAAVRAPHPLLSPAPAVDRCFVRIVAPEDGI